MSDKNALRKVWSCGKNDCHQLGLGHNENQGIPVPVPELEGKNLRKVVCGEARIWAVDGEDNMWVVGRQDFGELGLGHVNARCRIATINLT